MELNLQRQKERLLAQKQELEERVRNLTENGLGEPMARSVEELSSYDNHPADLGSELFERSKDLALRDNAHILLAKVNHALQKIMEGTYGYCTECGQAIPIERLEALPLTTLCIDCKSEGEYLDQHPRPIEEEVLLPPYGRLAYDSEDADQPGGVGYDGEDAWQEVARFGEHAQGSQAGAYYGDADLDEPRGTVEAVEEIPYSKGEDGVFYEDQYGLEKTDFPQHI